MTTRTGPLKEAPAPPAVPPPLRIKLPEPAAVPAKITEELAEAKLALRAVETEMSALPDRVTATAENADGAEVTRLRQRKEASGDLLTGAKVKLNRLDKARLEHEIREARRDVAALWPELRRADDAVREATRYRGLVGQRTAAARSKVDSLLRAVGRVEDRIAAILGEAGL